MSECLSEREQLNLRAENHRLRDLLSLLSHLSLRITSGLDLPAALQDVVDAACGLTGTRYGALIAFDSSGRIQHFITHGITAEERERIGDLPRGVGLLGGLQNAQQPLRLADLTRHPHAVGFPPGHPAMRSFLGVPLRHGNETLGNIYLAEKAMGEGFTPEDEALLTLFAGQAALAIHNALLSQEVEAGRNRVAELAAERGAVLDLAEQEQQRLQVLVDTSPVGVFVADAATGQMLLVNREGQRILGVAHRPEDRLERYEQAAVYRRPDGTAYLPRELPLHRAMLHGETVRAEEVRLEFPDGRTVTALVNAAPVYSVENGQITAAIGVVQDMTSLEELEKLRSEFLGIVSHELRTPLTAIKGSAATVLGSHRPLDDVETREFFQIIDEQADRLRDMVDNLLDMTRIEAGSMSVIAGPIDLREVLEETQEIFARSGVTQKVALQVPDDLPPVNADRRRVGQVLTNLLNNAAKFSPATAPITIEVEHDEMHITVHVRDQGRGIASANLPHLFKRFSQVQANDSGQRMAGSGLGLAISKGIVEAHGGRIWANSPGEGQGATFSFTLPVAARPVPTPLPDTSRRAEHQGKVSRAGERTRILTVDDEPRILRYLQRSLNEAGYQVTVTGDPREVTKLVELEEPDLVLLDLVLPGSSGFDLLQRIREFSGVPVIFLTARDRDEDMVQALKMGADDYITKPFSPSELLARIEAALRRRLLPDRIEVRPSFVLDDLTINFANRSVLVEGRAVSLSATEYKVLYELASHSGMVLTHDQILQRVWGPEYAGETELIRSFIRNLRRKLGDDARNPRYIFTEPQVGYRMPRPQP